MIWMDYTVEQAGPHFRIKGDWEGEVMGIGRDGTPKESMLYKPGDVFVVNESGWLMKKDELQVFLDKGKNK
tara:strand:- start:464 stop:676 length:213 start_codon:yes stop_codon:yes gene_type:complete